MAAVSIVSGTDALVVQGKCTPSIGSVYNVYVAEGCIPERDYISEMQDTSDRVSKQVKIYLRRCECMCSACASGERTQRTRWLFYPQAVCYALPVGERASNGAHAQAPARC